MDALLSILKDIVEFLDMLASSKCDTQFHLYQNSAVITYTKHFLWFSKIPFTHEKEEVAVKISPLTSTLRHGYLIKESLKGSLNV